jgi:hypothetical protein
MRYAGECSDCGQPREFSFAISERPTAPGEFTSWAADPEPSELVDAGQWLLVAESCQRYADGLTGDAAEFVQLRDWLALAGEDGAERARELLARSAAAVDEALKFLPAWADQLPESAFWTDEAAEARRDRPDRFTRRSLEAEQYERWQRLADLPVTTSG